MMSRCANCNFRLNREKELKNLTKLSWLNWEFDCPNCGSQLTTSCLWHEVLQVAVIVTLAVELSFLIFSLLGPAGYFKDLAIAHITLSLVLIGLMVVSIEKMRTRVLSV